MAPFRSANERGDEGNVMKSIITVVAVLALLWAELWCTVVAFTGGTLPLLGIYVDGGVGFGLLWLFVIGPALTGVVGMLTAAVVAGIATATGREIA
jgi:hypothetical protein